MSDCADHLQECFKLPASKMDVRWLADPDAKRVYECIAGLQGIGWPDEQRNRYAAVCHALYGQLRRDGLAFIACALLGRARTKAQNQDDLVDRPEFVLLAHLIACLGQDLSEMGIMDSMQLTGAYPLVGKIEQVVNALLDEEMSLDKACFLGLRALALSEWFKRYAESMLKITRQQAQDSAESMLKVTRQQAQDAITLTGEE